VKRIRRCPQFASACASENHGAAATRIDGYSVHAADIDDDAAAQRASDPTVSAASYRRRQAAIAGHADGQFDIVGCLAVNNGTG
jgi:hypothetical protein